MDINVLVIFNLFMLVIPIAVIVFIVKSLSNQRKMKEEIEKLNLKVEKLSEKLHQNKENKFMNIKIDTYYG